MVNEEEKVGDIYNQENLEDLEENDEISEAEEGFMQGYEGNIKDPEKCVTCGKLLECDHFIEKEIEGVVHKFCNDKCADDYDEK